MNLGDEGRRGVRGRVTDAAPEVDSADVDREALARYVKRAQGGNPGLLRERAKRNPSLKGKVVVRFSITTSGRASEIEIEENTLGNEAVGSCIRTMIRSWVFPFKPDDDVRSPTRSCSLPAAEDASSMKPKRLSNEVRALVALPEFQAGGVGAARAVPMQPPPQERYDELLAQTTLTEFRAELTQKNAIDTLYRAGECEDRAANMLFEATELENQSFRAIADFEEQRFRPPRLWYRLGAAEKKPRRERRTQQEAQPGDRASWRVAERRSGRHRRATQRETARKTRLLGRGRAAVEQAAPK